MRVALLIGANPRSHMAGPIAIIPPGNWKIVAESLSDSEVILKNHSQQLSIHDTVELKVHTGFTPEFIVRGTERTVSVFAEKINGNEHGLA